MSEETLLWSASFEADKAPGSLTPNLFFGYNTASEKDQLVAGFSHGENPSANTFSLQGKHFFEKTSSFSFLVNGSYQDTHRQQSLLKGGLVASWTFAPWSIVPSVSGGRNAVHGSGSVSDVIPALEVDYDLTDEVSLAASYTFHNKLDASYYYEVDLSYQPLKEQKHLTMLVGAGKDSFVTMRVDLRF